MSYTRLRIVSLLEKEFAENRGMKERLRQLTLARLKTTDTGMASRVFDHFPCLLPDDEMNALSVKFKKILEEINIASIQQKKENPVITDKTDIEKFNEWIDEIATIAVKELLDGNGHIGIDLIKLLAWDDFNSKLGRNSKLTHAIVKGYALGINAVLMIQFKKLLIDDNDIDQSLNTAVSRYINQNMGDCVVKKIKNYVKPNPLDPLDTSHLRNKEEITSHAMTRALLGGGTALVGYGMFRYYQSREKESKPKVGRPFVI